MKYTVKFTDYAESDLEELLIYITDNDGREKAVQLYQKLKEKILGLASLPHRGRVVPELKRIDIYDFFEIVITPYRIIYFIEHDVIYISAIFDGRRDLEDVIFKRMI